MIKYQQYHYELLIQKIVNSSLYAFHHQLFGNYRLQFDYKDESSFVIDLFI